VLSSRSAPPAAVVPSVVGAVSALVIPVPCRLVAVR
jgi:hypothetical protein